MSISDTTTHWLRHGKHGQANNEFNLATIPPFWAAQKMHFAFGILRWMQTIKKKMIFIFRQCARLFLRPSHANAGTNNNRTSIHKNETRQFRVQNAMNVASVAAVSGAWTFCPQLCCGVLFH